jgi:sterol 3beta-glucosyltransferase
MKQIAIVASGTQGDVQPYIALGKGLRGAGYQVRLLVSDQFASAVTSAGLDFYATGPSAEARLQSAEWRTTLEKGNFLTVLRKMQAEMKDSAVAMAELTVAGLQGSELIVTGMVGLTGVFSIAEKLTLPVIQAHVFPFTPTRAFPSPLTPHLPFGRVLNPLSFHLMHQLFWQSFNVSDTATRRVLGLPKQSFWGPFRALQQRPEPTLYGYSRHVLPHAPEWNERTQVTGYWFLDPPSDWTPPADLVRFLEAGEPPVYIGFGSMAGRNPAATANIVVEALALAGRRGVLASGWGGLQPTDLPDSIHMLASIPHSWLFERMAAVVHHGGAGTTAAGLRAGVPSIIVPFSADQPFWGRRVADLGVGPRPLPRKQLTAERLAAAITTALTTPAIGQAAADLGRRIRAEDGVGNAIALIDRYLHTTSTPISSHQA